MTLRFALFMLLILAADQAMPDGSLYRRMLAMVLVLAAAHVTSAKWIP